MENNGKEIKIARLEEQVKSVQSDINEIKVNHLAHLSNGLADLSKEVSKVQIRMAYYVGGTAVIGWGIQALISWLH